MFIQNDTIQAKAHDRYYSIINQPEPQSIEDNFSPDETHYLLCIPARVTTLSIARWPERGSSYRTGQRWYHTPLEWATILWTRTVLFKFGPSSDQQHVVHGGVIVHIS